MTEAVVADSRSVLALSPAEREEAGVTDEEVQAALEDVVEHGDADHKRIEGCHLPAVDLAYDTVAGETNHPVVFSDCTVEGPLRAVGAHVTLPVHFEDCTVEGLALEDARFETDFVMRDCTVTGEVDAFEARFDRDADFRETTFEAETEFDECLFGGDSYFDDATFAASTSFHASRFSGTSNELEDNASFTGATFEADADFHQAQFRYASFEGAAFGDVVGFQEVAFEGDAVFRDVRFDGEADFDELDCVQDVTFEDVVFGGRAVFRGAEFEGGARSLEDDARFAGVTFEGDTDFRDAHFRDGNFERAGFEGQASFERVRFDGDAAFTSVRIGGEADFDEARFHGDARFDESTFESAAVFRGAEFSGDSNHLKESASFASTRFEGPLEFDDASFSSAAFERTEFTERADFTGATFERAVLHFLPVQKEAYVDLTGAVLREGTIRQPESRWVHYDLTRASVGDVSLDAEREADHRELLDYFRVCNTEFNEFDGYEFDFSAHTDYLDRNDWTLHHFDGGDVSDAEYAESMTPETIERTYLKAKSAASAAGQMKAAGEFRVKRQQYARKKYVSIATDAGTDARTRLKNLGRATENAFLGVTCGHGLRLYRIVAVFLLTPLVPALLYAFGGPAFRTGAGQIDSLGQLATPAGQAVLYENVHFSYITFLTIGYGNVGPQGALARLLAGLEVYGSVILSGLVLYGLIKRSEI